MTLTINVSVFWNINPCSSVK